MYVKLYSTTIVKLRETQKSTLQDQMYQDNENKIKFTSSIIAFKSKSLLCVQILSKIQIKFNNI